MTDEQSDTSAVGAHDSVSDPLELPVAELLAQVAHELRNPLAAIQLWASSLRGKQTSPEQQIRIVDAILESAKVQSQLVENLIELSRAQTGTLRIDRRHVALNALLELAIERVRGLVKASEVSLTLALTTELGTLETDAARLEQALVDLLLHACKVSGTGHVQLRALREDEWVELHIEEQPVTHAPTAEQAPNRTFSIGVALAHKVLVALGAELHERANGIAVRLPAAAQVRSSVAPAPRQRLAGATVLVIEDEDSVREAVQYVLEDADAKVLTADSGLTGLQLVERDAGSELEAAHIDVILCDLELPDMDGYELIQAVVSSYRCFGRTPPPASALSAHASEADRARAIAAGFDLHLAKPLTADKLIEAVADLWQVARTKPSAPLDDAVAGESHA